MLQNIYKFKSTTKWNSNDLFVDLLQKWSRIIYIKGTGDEQLCRSKDNAGNL